MEGDRYHIIHCWKYFVLRFKSSRRSKYSITAFNFLTQYHSVLSPRMAMQLTWNRTVNTPGNLGKNIPCDLHMKYLNREATNCVAALGTNISDAAVIRIGKSNGVIIPLLKWFDRINGLKEPSSRHSKQSTEKAMSVVLKRLIEVGEVFTYIPGQSHDYFRKVQSNPIRHRSMSNLPTAGTAITKKGNNDN